MNGFGWLETIVTPGGGTLDNVTRPNRPRLGGALWAVTCDGLTLLPPGFRQQGNVRFILMLQTAETMIQRTISGPNITYRYISVICSSFTVAISQLAVHGLATFASSSLTSASDPLLLAYFSVMTDGGGASTVTCTSEINVYENINI